MSSVVIAGDTSGTVTLQAPSVAGTTTITLPSTSGTMATTSALGGGATTTTGSSNITLTASSNRVQSVTMTATDKSVTLPDATTISSLGGPLFIIGNYGIFPFSIKNASGYSIAQVTSNQTVMLSLADNSTSAGVWFSEDATYDLSFSDWATVTSSNVPTNSWSWSDGNWGITSSKISSTSAIVSWQQGTSGRDIYAAVVSYSGSTITVGTPTLIYSGSTTASFGNKVLMLDSTNGFMFVSRNANNVVVPFTLSGTTITVGTTSSTYGTSASGANLDFGQAISMSSTVAVHAYRTNTTAPYTWVINTFTHNGSSAPTIGTASSTVSVFDVYSGPSLYKIDSTNLVMAYSAVTTVYPVIRTATLSGTSAPTLNTANTTATIPSGNDGVAMGIFQVSSSEYILYSGQFNFNYTLSGSTFTYVGYKQYSSDTTTAIYSYYLGSNCILGNNIISNQYNYSGAPYLALLARSGSYIYLKSTNNNSGKNTAFYNNGEASYLTGLDSTTAFLFTNNADVGSVYASVIKYIGTI